MAVFMYVCIRMYAYTYACMQREKSSTRGRLMAVFMYVCIRMYAYTYACMHARTLSGCVYVRVCIRMYAYTHACMQRRRSVATLMYTYTHGFMHMCTCMYAYVCISEEAVL
jgi:hypothetical protein